MDKVYAVIEYGGEYEDSWENIIGICSSPELADELKVRIENEHSPSNAPISKEEWETITDQLCLAEERGFEYDTEEEGIKKLFPEYSIDDIRKSMYIYNDIWDWSGVTIREINFYTDLSDIINGN